MAHGIRELGFFGGGSIGGWSCGGRFFHLDIIAVFGEEHLHFFIFDGGTGQVAKEVGTDFFADLIGSVNFLLLGLEFLLLFLDAFLFLLKFGLGSVVRSADG